MIRRPAIPRLVVALSLFVLLTGCLPVATPTVVTPTVSVAYDSETIAVELFEAGWATDSPLPDAESDVYKKWIDSTFNFDFKLTSTTAATFNDMLITRIASGTAPTIIAFRNGINTHRKLYDQGVLVDDFTPYLAYAPTIVQYNLTASSKLQLTRNGKLIGLCNIGRSQAWALQIRKDWLTELNLPMPRTADELMAFIRAAKVKKLGGETTIGITTSETPMGVTGWSFGYNWDAFTCMFGPENWFITDDGKLSHAIVAGYKESMLKFCKTCIDEGNADPDWATQDWNGKSFHFWSGKVGLVFYPFEAVVNETNGSKMNPKDALDMWTQFTTMPVGGPAGGKYQTQIDEAFTYSFPKDIEADKNTMIRLVKFIDSVQYPNEDYWKLRYGVGIDNVTRTVLDSGANYIYTDPEKVGKTSHVMASVDGYATWIATNDLSINGNTVEASATVIEIAKQMKIRFEAPSYPMLTDLMVFDTMDVDATNKVFSEFYVDYLLGKDTDYAKFVTDWLAAGGQHMLDQGTEQLKAVGVLK